ncbi:MAG: hypothetical protein PHE27_01605 [Alphaproteobacteria bacterium]|nr:hypothetical protein [Alphaproteobacteria bacterium]
MSEYDRKIEELLGKIKKETSVPRRHGSKAEAPSTSRLHCADGWVEVRRTPDMPYTDERIAEREHVEPGAVNGLVIADTIGQFRNWAQQRKIHITRLSGPKNNSGPQSETRERRVGSSSSGSFRLYCHDGFVEVRPTRGNMNVAEQIALREHVEPGEVDGLVIDDFVNKFRKWAGEKNISIYNYHTRPISEEAFQKIFGNPEPDPAPREHGEGSPYYGVFRIHCDDGIVDVRRTSDNMNVARQIAMRERVDPNAVDGLVIDDGVKTFMQWAHEENIDIYDYSFRSGRAVSSQKQSFGSERAGPS